MKQRVRYLAVFVSLMAFVPLTGRGGKFAWKLPAGFDVRAKQHIETLVKIGPRPTGSMNESRAADYIAVQFNAMGIAAAIEPFAFESFEPTEIELKIGGRDFAPVGLGMDPYAGMLSYSGASVPLDPRAPTQWPVSAAVAGKAVVTAAEGDTTLHFRIMALQPLFIIDLARTDFDTVMGFGSGELTLVVRGGLVKGISRNVIAHVGAQEPAPQIIIGAHLDAFRDCPGANDNATGVAALLELARYVQGAAVPEGIGMTFIAFGGEESAILGSRNYAENHAKELQYCSLALVFDDLGGDGPVHVERNGGRLDQPKNPGIGNIPQAFRGKSWGGLHFPWMLLPPVDLLAALGYSYHPAWLTASIDEAVKDLDFPVQFTPIQGSDQTSFAQAGIVTSGISAVNGRGHTQSDRPETVNIDKVRQCVETAIRILEKIWAHLRLSSVNAFSGSPSYSVADTQTASTWIKNDYPSGSILAW